MIALFTGSLESKLIRRENLMYEQQVLIFSRLNKILVFAFAKFLGWSLTISFVTNLVLFGFIHVAPILRPWFLSRTLFHNSQFRK